MLTKPSVAQMIRTVRRELLERIAPELSDEALRISMGMIGTILHVAAERADLELEWMRAESAEIEHAVANAMAYGTHDAALVAAQQHLLADQNGAADAADPHARYATASEALSCLLEASVRADDLEQASDARRLLERRVQRELEIIGDSFYGVSS